MKMILQIVCCLVCVEMSWSAKLQLEDVTAGSTMKLLNKGYGVRLHSHDIKYGSGSGQQSVTGMNSEVDANSYWQVRSPSDEVLARGSPIKCGQAVRLTHVRTTTNLHSHHVNSPLSNEQEVSAYGSDGEGDHLDDWIVVCNGKYWSRDQYVRFRHKETQAYLGCSGRTYGRPIHGQHEIMASLSSESSSGKYWKAMEGVFVMPSENMSMKYTKNVSRSEKERGTEDDATVEQERGTEDDVTVEPSFSVVQYFTKILYHLLDYFYIMFNWVFSVNFSDSFQSIADHFR